MIDTITSPSSKRNILLLVLGELAALAVAAVAVIRYDLGWIGAIGIAVLVVGFTLLIVRAGEKNAAATGNSSPAMLRYNRRMLAASAVYVVGLFGAIYAHDTFGIGGAAAFLVALVPSVGVLMMVWAMGRLVTEETDEYLRYRYVRASLFGVGTLLTIATVWGFFEQFDLVPHAPTWLAVPIFALGLGISNCVSWGRK
jgi:hypothetical protein